MKKTEIGEIPEDWKIISLGDIGRVSSCKRIMKHQTKLTGEIPFYKIGTFGKEPDAYISGGIYEDYKSKYLFPKKGEILISASGTIGRTVIYDGEQAYFQDSNIIWISNNENIVKNNLLFYCYKMIRWNTEDTTIARLYNDNMKRILIPIPKSLKEQEAIAQVLSDTDELIEKLNALIEKKKLIKKGAMQELLTGKKRLPGFSGEWERKELGKTGTILMGQSPRGDSYSTSINDVPLLNGAVDLKENGIEIKQYTNKPTRISKKDDLLFCIRATIGNLNIGDREYCLGRGVAALTVGKDNDRRFVSHLLSNLFELMKRSSEGGVIKGLRKTELNNFLVYLPKDPAEQTAIANILSDMDEEIESLEQKRDKYKLLKNGMMQQLLTGRIRLV